MLENSLPKEKVARKGWGIPGALFLGLSAYLLPTGILIVFAPGVQALLFGANITNFLYTAIFEVLVIAILFIFVNAYGLRLRDLGLKKFKLSHLWLLPISFVVYLAASVAISTIFSLFINYDQNQVQELGFNNPTGGEILLVFLALVVLAPLAEELLFRGFIFQGIRKRLKFWPTAIIVSALFALVHGQINVGLDVLALSMVLCWLRDRTSSLWPSIMLHATKNSLAFLLLYVFKVV